MDRLPTFLAQYAGDLSAYSVDVTERLAGQLPTLLKQWSRQHATHLIHGDARLDNVVRWHDQVRLIDWQMASGGEGLFDVAHFLGGSLTIERRRAQQGQLLDAYAVESGLPRSEVEDSFRRLMLLVIPLNVVFGTAPEQSDQTARNRRDVIRRYWTAIDDLQAGDFVT